MAVPLREKKNGLMTLAQRRGPIWIVAGTRPEVIKLAPVYQRACTQFGSTAVQWVSTGQHMALEAATLSRFSISPGHVLTKRSKNGSIAEFSARIIRGLAELQDRVRPRLVIVQGDTASTFAGAYSAFHAAIPVAHVEAGLRTDDIHDPFPEEAYRRMTDAMADLHFAPTRLAADRLRAEGYSNGSVVSTGNTAIDAVAMVDSMTDDFAPPELAQISESGRLLFVTMHRRESWGRPMEELCRAIRDVVQAYDDIQVVLPVHVNPIVRKTVTEGLTDVPRVILTPPLDFVTCHALIRKSHLILTDSGGIAEEAPSYGVPVLILRKSTERPEAMQAGLARLTGTDRQTVVSAAREILDDPKVRARMSGAHNPYGDGRAAERIVLGIGRFLAGERPILTEQEQYL